jgi:hypothetical protein
MKPLFAVCLFALGLVAASAPAAAEDVAVPIVKAPYHRFVFRNTYVTLLDVYVPPGRTTGYHTHTGDSVSVNIEEADMTNQDWGAAKPGPARHSRRGIPTYADYRTTPKTHKAVNVGTTPFHNISFIFNSPKPYGLTPGSRAVVPAYRLMLDNARVRAWRITLGPGESVPAITQGSPGLRIVVDGGELVEQVPGQPDRPMILMQGGFYWQDASVTRALKNAGTTPITLVECELK